MSDEMRKEMRMMRAVNRTHADQIEAELSQPDAMAVLEAIVRNGVDAAREQYGPEAVDLAARAAAGLVRLELQTRQQDREREAMGMLPVEQ